MIGAEVAGRAIRAAAVQILRRVAREVDASIAATGQAAGRGVVVFPAMEVRAVRQHRGHHVGHG